MVGRVTVSRVARIEGKGLHTGLPAAVTIGPAAPGEGIRFRRVDLPGAPVIPADVDHVKAVQRGTSLGRHGAVIHTVEHVLSAVWGLGYDDLVIDVEGTELPIGDGSAGPYVRVLREAGRHEVDAPVTVLAPDRPLTVTEGTANYVVVPAERLALEVTIEWEHPLIGRQTGCYAVTPEGYEAELAGARTFGFMRERGALQALGLARGATAENVIVLTEKGVLSGALRWPDEFVRHKALDVIGDLALIGGRLLARVTAHRPSHAGNAAVARAIRHAIMQESGL